VEQATQPTAPPAISHKTTFIDCILKSRFVACRRAPRTVDLVSHVTGRHGSLGGGISGL
jgi:hypothetical protein